MTMQGPKTDLEILGRVLTGGIYSVPLVGKRAAQMRQFFDAIAPLATDSTGVRVAKNTLRYGTVTAAGVGAAAATAVVVL